MLHALLITPLAPLLRTPPTMPLYSSFSARATAAAGNGVSRRSGWGSGLLQPTSKKSVCGNKWEGGGQRRPKGQEQMGDEVDKGGGRRR